ncbi:hypothetical protein H6P81_008505 [Aristolochia fimbriata]|uniref:Uncharacterized protein n=1 Tax=Aristolochia fimbriata TaxID=158543 RepID=A0AAV7EKB6_ARIFI|nr:hypothetical protein H6P81_008505 [Aristolochia fimbriata]
MDPSKKLLGSIPLNPRRATPHCTRPSHVLLLRRKGTESGEERAEKEMIGKSIVALQAALGRRTSSRIATKRRLREERIQQKRRRLTSRGRSETIDQEWRAADGVVAHRQDIRSSERRLECWTDGATCCGESSLEITAFAPADQDAYAKVEETLRIFDAYYNHFVHQEERRCREVNDDDAIKFRRKMKRPDLKAISAMKHGNLILHPKRIGAPEGIEVGRRFLSRAEMMVVGLHGHWMNGIDFLGASYGNTFEYRHFIFPIAVSVVISGEYEDDIDNLVEVIYTGEGGNNYVRSDHQHRDQTLTGGNLALKNSMTQQIPVRVTRGHVSKSNFNGKLYTYDGLYSVDECWNCIGVSGYKVWKYRLNRLPGQPPLTTNQVHFVRADRSPRFQLTNRQPMRRLKHHIRSLKSSMALSRRSITCSSQTQARALESPGTLSRQKILNVLPNAMRLPGTVILDISEGQEKPPIPATNLIDDPPVAPTGYKYSTSLRINKPDLVLPAAIADGCNGEGKEIVLQCSDNCQCGLSCRSRTSNQELIRYRLEVFRTTKKRWALRSWDPIPAGSVICECAGVLKRTGGLGTLGRCDFVLGIDWLQEQKGSERSSHEVPQFCVDARKVGNVARFINHSCRPNVFLQLVFGPPSHAKPATDMMARSGVSPAVAAHPTAGSDEAILV